jgi:hypothetical protein
MHEGQSCGNISQNHEDALKDDTTVGALQVPSPHQMRKAAACAELLHTRALTRAAQAPAVAKLTAPGSPHLDHVELEPDGLAILRAAEALDLVRQSVDDVGMAQVVRNLRLLLHTPMNDACNISRHLQARPRSRMQRCEGNSSGARTRRC